MGKQSNNIWNQLPQFGKQLEKKKKIKKSKNYAMPEIRLPSFNDFSPKILGGDIRTCLQAVVDGKNDDENVCNTWAKLYFGGAKNKRSTANIPATLRSTGLTTGVRPMALSEAGKLVLGADSAVKAAKLFCGHILRHKNGKYLVEALSALNKRRKSVTKVSLKDELISLGVTGLSNNTTDHSTLKNWLIFSGLADKKGIPINAEIKVALGISSNEIDDFKSLSLGQQVFLNLLRRRHETSSGPFQVSDLLRECMDTHPHLFDEAQFAKKVRRPLEAGGWLVVEGLAKGAHGGRSGKVHGSRKLRDIPVSEVIPDFEQVIPSDLRSKLNMPLHEVSHDLFGADTYKAGIALELLALRMIMDLGLQPRHFRLRSAQTAHAEVDLIAEGAHLLFSRWTFQCKRYGRETNSRLRLGDVAKEVGIAIFAKAHVVVMVTTTDFTQDAKDYAAEVTRATHLQFVFIDGAVIDAYLSQGRDVLRQHFLTNARTVMEAKRYQPLASGD